MIFYSREIIRRVREEAHGRPANPKAASILAAIPDDAPMDGATLTVWNGERWAAYDRWLATAPIIREHNAEDRPTAANGNVGCVAGDCGERRIWLVKDGDRWLIYAGSRKPGARRKDFASPYFAHAAGTAEAWYGEPHGGWRPERNRDEKSVQETESIPSQDFDYGEGARQ